MESRSLCLSPISCATIPAVGRRVFQVWVYQAPRTLHGLSGQSLGDVGQGGPGQGPADGEGEVSCGSGGDTQLEGWFTCAGVHLGRNVRAKYMAVCWLVACSYLAGVDATLHITSTQVVGLDGPSIKLSAVADFEVDEIDHGLLQDIRRSSSCKQIRGIGTWQLIASSSPPPR